MVTKRLTLFFPKSESEKPIVYHLVKDHNLVINIFRAKVTPEEFGYLVLDVSGDEADVARGMEYVRSFNVDVRDSVVGVSWNADRCTHCGACLAHCPTDALRIADPATRTILFESSACVECLACLKVCPYGACSSLY
jgi:L-aspartate semialdehyde sulfurtransferase ferredoxin